MTNADITMNKLPGYPARFFEAEPRRRNTGTDGTFTVQLPNTTHSQLQADSPLVIRHFFLIIFFLCDLCVTFTPASFSVPPFE